jgi:predicted metal-dependent enzyme (double-stranded beta helix superfamily)
MNEMSQIAAKRQAACAALLQRVREINGSGPMRAGALEKVKGLLSDFAVQGSDLFPETEFALPNAHGRNYPLIEAADDGYGLYLLVSRPGKESAPHDHGIWCATAGLEGIELQRYYRRTDDGRKPGFATVEQIGEMTIAQGKAMVMQDHDIHSTIVTGNQVSRAIGLYGYALTRFPAVIYYHPQFNSCRTLPSRRSETAERVAV